MTQKQILRKLEAIKARQAKVRDEIRDLADELEAHLQNADEAIDDLERAADAVSRLV
jgi:hypothetical protein